MLSIGQPPYFSTLPITHPLSGGRIAGDYQLVSSRLTELSRQLVEGTLDAGPITVQLYVEHRELFEPVPNLCVSSWGRASIGMLFATKPLWNPRDYEVVVPSRAAGIVTILRSLMMEMYGIEPVTVEKSGPLEELLAEHGAALLYEDEALKASLQVGPEIETWDLGDAWWELTHTPLIYMMWVTRASLPQDQREEIHRILAEAKAIAQADHTSLLACATERYGLDETLLAGFLSRFSYDFTPSHEAGLKLLTQTLTRLEPQAN